MENKINAEAAALELQRIVDFFEVDPEGDDWQDNKTRLLQAIQKGRLTLDEDNVSIIQGLVSPITTNDGKTITELKFHEPDAGDLKTLDKYKDHEKMAKTVHLASRMTGESIGVLDHMRARDLATMGAIASLFF